MQAFLIILHISSHIYSLSEGKVMELSHKTKIILNDDGGGENLGCNPDGK